jgi:hypothetical protein
LKALAIKIVLRSTETTVKPMVGNRTQDSKPTVL